MNDRDYAAQAERDAKTADMLKSLVDAWHDNRAENEALRAEVERLTKERDEARAANAPAIEEPEGWPDSPVVGELQEQLMRSRTAHKAAEAELARLRPVVEAAKAQAHKARSVMSHRGGPLSADHDFMGFVCATNEAADVLRAAEGGDAHART